MKKFGIFMMVILTFVIITTYLIVSSNFKKLTENVIETNTLSKKITPENYGDYIKYPIDLNSDGDTTNDWKIFYNDGENVFIIASDICKNSYIPDNVGIEKNGDYNIYWNENVDEFYTGSLSIDYDIGTKFMFSWLDKWNDYSSRPMRAVASLLDNRIWNCFIDENYADMAIGSPTLEMFVASWNSKGYGSVEIEKMEIGGYDVCVDGQEYGIDFKFENEGREDTLYFPEKYEEYGEQYKGYILATHYLGGNSVNLYDIGYCSVAYTFYYDPFICFRPVVCLKTDINASRDNNGVWNFIN